MLFVKDLSAMATFYAAVLGAELRPADDAAFVELAAAGHLLLALHAIPPEVAQHVHVSNPPARRGDSASKVRFRTSELGCTCARVTSAGGNCDESFEWAGQHYCDCVDPEGNVFQLVQ